MAKRNQIQVWTVRNHKDQLIGRYRAVSAEIAIRCAQDEQASYGSFFRGQSVKLNYLFAKVEKE